MNCNDRVRRTIWILLIVFLFNVENVSAQVSGNTKSEFWRHVQFGGGVGVSIGSGYTDVTLAPGAIYNFNDYFALGLGLQGSYVKVKNEYNATIYGGSILALLNPIEQIQLSAEIEQVRVNAEYQITGFDNIEDNFWNTALFLGAGYRVENITIGARYNVLHRADRRVYADAFMPFVRVYF